MCHINEVNASLTLSLILCLFIVVFKMLKHSLIVFVFSSDVCETLK